MARSNRIKFQRKFHGEFDQLEAVVIATGSSGQWEWMPAEFWQYKSPDGAILNWWPSTKTIDFQGSLAARVALEQAIADAVSGPHSADIRLLNPHKPTDFGEQS